MYVCIILLSRVVIHSERQKSIKRKENKMKMKVMMIVAVALVAALWRIERAAAAASMVEKCGADFQKLAVCLTYATGKAAEPTKDCCDSVKGIKDSEPECLCYIMQQTHDGNDKVKSMGIQESKLLTLPTACAVKNASLAECPKLLGLSPSSPDAAIFTNNSTTAPATTPAAPGKGTLQSQTGNDSSNEPRIVPHLAGLLAMAVAGIAFFAFS